VNIRKKFIKTNIKLYQVLVVMIIVLASWGMRVAYIYNTKVDNPVRADARDYVSTGYNLARHHIYSSVVMKAVPPVPDKKRPPGYPFFLAAIFAMTRNFPNFFNTVLNTQCILDTLTVLGTFLIACRFLPFWAAIAAAILTGISPHLIVMTGYLLSETLYSFLLLFGILFSTLAVKKQKPLFYLVSGILFAAATLTRSALVLFPLVVAFCMFFIASGIRKRNLKLVSIFLVGFLILLLPWSLRNMRLKIPENRKFNPALTSFIHGSYPNFTYKTARYYGYPYREDPQISFMMKNWKNTFGVLKTRFVKAPWSYLKWYLGGKILALWQWDNRAGGTGDIYVYPFVKSGFRDVAILRLDRIIAKISYLPSLLLGLLGMVLFAIGRKWKDPEYFGLMVCLALLLYFAGIHTILAPFPRYSVPLRPYLFILGMFALSDIWERWKHWNSSPSTERVSNNENLS